MENKLYKSENQKSRQEVAEFLRDLAGKVEQGSLVLPGQKGEVNIEFPESMVLEYDVEEKTKDSGSKMSLEVELEWYR